MLVSVLMTTYNHAEFVERAVCSVLNQSTYEDFDLRVIDDGSTDGTANILRAFDDSRMSIELACPSTLARKATVRYATLLNRLAAESTGDLLTFLCGDDYFLPDRLGRMVAKIEAGNDVVYGAQLLLDQQGQQIGCRPASGVLDDAYHRVDLNSVMVTREAFHAVGGFPDRPATSQLWREADARLWRRLTNAGYRFVPVDGDGPTDAKQYLDSGVDARVIAGLEPW